MMLTAIGLIGAGNMGSALIRGLIRAEKSRGDQISVFDIDEKRTQYLGKEYGIVAASSPSDTVQPDTRMLILAVKPQVIEPVLDSISDSIHDRPLVISVAAGIPTALLLSHLPAGARVIRAMPNAAALVGQSATALCKGGAADDEDLRSATDLFDAVGRSVIVEEHMMNAVTALSGSGPGYLFAVMEGLTDGGVRMGLDRATSRQLTVQTVLGAAALAAHENAAFSDLKDRITSPGGTTIAGLQVLERAGLRGILMEAVEAATRRGEELLARG
ncbi:MAG: pyrroline-5-carboxylate reductase [Deltaproteobacteria bacterium]